nr:IS3 family transposase [Ktedonobacter racemifer]
MGSQVVCVTSLLSSNLWRLYKNGSSAPTESFFGTLKREWTHRQNYQTQTQARQSIFDDIETFYNRKRRHSALGYLSPVTYEEQNRKEPVTNV